MWLMKRRVSLSMMPDWQSQLNIQRAALSLSYILDLGRLQRVQRSNNSNVTWLPRVSEGTVEEFLISSATQIFKNYLCFFPYWFPERKKRKNPWVIWKKNKKKTQHIQPLPYFSSHVCVVSTQQWGIIGVLHWQNILLRCTSLNM